MWEGLRQSPKEVLQKNQGLQRWQEVRSNEEVLQENGWKEIRRSFSPHKTKNWGIVSEHQCSEAIPFFCLSVFICNFTPRKPLSPVGSGFCTPYYIGVFYKLRDKERSKERAHVFLIFWTPYRLCLNCIIGASHWKLSDSKIHVSRRTPHSPRSHRSHLRFHVFR